MVKLNRIRLFLFNVSFLVFAVLTVTVRSVSDNDVKSHHDLEDHHSEYVNLQRNDGGLSKHRMVLDDLTSELKIVFEQERLTQYEEAGETTTMTASSAVTDYRCSCRSCGLSGGGAWNNVANGLTCGNRIDHLLSAEPNLYSTEQSACTRVAKMEYPTECGACNPETCDNRTPPTEPLYFCGGCSTCTRAVFYKSRTTSDASNPVSCGARITWLMSHERVSESAACTSVAQQFPSECGLCDTSTCTTIVQNRGNNNNANPPPAVTPARRQPVIGAVFVPPSIGSPPVLRPRPAQQPNTVPRTQPTIRRPVGVIQNTDSVSNTVFTTKDLGKNVILIDNTMSTAQIQGLFDDIYYSQNTINDEMGTQRHCIFFQPGTYGSANEPLMIKIGYYTEVSGLGSNPNQVQINGKIEVYNRCFEASPYEAGKFIPTQGGNGSLCFALNNFWRSLSNVAINIVSLNQDTCRSRAMFWAISQASSMRRVDIRGGEVSLMDYCTEPGYASGGYIADSRAGKIFNGSQQQFVARNMDISEWDGGVWNQVFLGVNGAPNDSAYPDPPYTTFNKSPLSREKPYLYNENGAYYVRVPKATRHSAGITWGNGQLTPGSSIPISAFFIVNTSHSVDRINTELSSGKHLIFTPGVYDIPSTIYVRKANTVVLGLGLATLTAKNGVVIMQLANEPGIIVAGMTFDAGTSKSDVLLRVGPSDTKTNGAFKNPTTLNDVYFRVGGPHVGKADICLEVNSDNVLIDHTWIWRADHGVENFNLNDGFEGDNERWRTNTGRLGLLVKGANVTATGLFVEHYQEYNVVWKGEGGEVYFFQNELPYDPPTQSDWTTPDGVLGFAGYKVSNEVQSHTLWSGGVYSYNRNNPSIITANAFEVPNRPGVKVHKAYTRNLSGPGLIKNIVNGIGQQVDSNDKGPYYVKMYPR